MKLESKINDIGVINDLTTGTSFSQNNLSRGCESESTTKYKVEEFIEVKLESSLNENVVSGDGESKSTVKSELQELTDDKSIACDFDTPTSVYSANSLSRCRRSARNSIQVKQEELSMSSDQKADVERDGKAAGKSKVRTMSTLRRCYVLIRRLNLPSESSSECLNLFQSADSKSPTHDMKPHLKRSVCSVVNDSDDEHSDTSTESSASELRSRIKTEPSCEKRRALQDLRKCKSKLYPKVFDCSVDVKRLDHQRSGSHQTATQSLERSLERSGSHQTATRSLERSLERSESHQTATRSLCSANSIWTQRSTVHRHDAKLTAQHALDTGVVDASDDSYDDESCDVTMSTSNLEELQYWEAEELLKVERNPVKDQARSREVSRMIELDDRAKSNICPTCNKVFKTFYLLKRHVIVNHIGHKLHNCDHCKKSFSFKAYLQQHISKVHSEANFLCFLCDFKSMYKTCLQIHMDSIHMQNKPYSCTKCDMSFTVKYALKLHTRSVHTNEKPYKCPRCGMDFAVNHRLDRHMKAVHLRERPFECSLCENKFKRNSHLQRHILAMHSKLRSFGCKRCTKRFKTRYAASNHMQLVHDC